MNKKTGLVVPVFTTRFIKTTMDLILSTCDDLNPLICIVNNGQPEVKNYLEKLTFPENVIVINLQENICFAGANNAGWHYLIKNFPDIELLGSISDDTKPYDGWLRFLVEAFEKYQRIGIAAPVMESIENGSIMTISTWMYNNISNPMIVRDWAITDDTFVSVVGGFCFLANREALEKVDFFDRRYQNSCEDVDISLKMLNANYRLVVCSRSKVFHYGGASRWLKDSGTNTSASLNLLSSKWGYDLSKYNII